VGLQVCKVFSQVPEVLMQVPEVVPQALKMVPQIPKVVPQILEGGSVGSCSSYSDFGVLLQLP
jgi:hypothetical protein